jgi:hypothetical protein
LKNELLPPEPDASTTKAEPSRVDGGNCRMSPGYLTTAPWGSCSKSGIVNPRI